MNSPLSQNLTDLARFDDAARPSVPVINIYSDDEPTERIPAVSEIDIVRAEFAEALAKVMARLDAVEARIDAAEGDGR